MKINKKTSTKSERNCYKSYDDIRICNLDEIGISNLETRKTGNLNSTDCVTDDDLFKWLIDTIHEFAKKKLKIIQRSNYEST